MLIRLILLATATAALALTLASPIQHDYVYYLEQWQLVLAGQDPWSTNNAYGPLHNLFAYLVPLSPLAPKLLMAGAFLIASHALVLGLASTRPVLDWVGPGLVVLGLNALLIVSVYVYGLNDGLVAALVIGAIFARLRNRLLLAGFLLGLATLDKYYPALLIPFFALDARVLQPRLVLSALGTIALGLIAATAIWGTLWLEAVTYGVSRDATIFSVLRPITMLGRQNGLGDEVDLLVRLNGPMVVLIWLGAIAIAWWRRDNWLTSACWGLLAVLLTYKVGNPQFFVTWLAMVGCLPLLNSPDADRLLRLSLPYALFLTLFELGYALLEPRYYQGSLLWVVEWVGVPSFILGITLLILWFRPASRPQS
ncbi:MAG: glycosyltransferase 87 family protein [Devosia sp.]